MTLLRSAPHLTNVLQMTTTATATTDRDGQFEMRALELGHHVLRIRHADFAARVLTDVVIDDAKPFDLGDVRLDRGCLVEGSVGGVRVSPGPFEVQIAEIDPTTPNPYDVAWKAHSIWPEVQARSARFRAATRTDDCGDFCFAERLPDGHYTVRFVPATECEPGALVTFSGACEKCFRIEERTRLVELDRSFTSRR